MERIHQAFLPAQQGWLRGITSFDASWIELMEIISEGRLLLPRLFGQLFKMHRVTQQLCPGKVSSDCGHLTICTVNDSAFVVPELLFRLTDTVHLA